MLRNSIEHSTGYLESVYYGVSYRAPKLFCELYRAADAYNCRVALYFFRSRAFQAGRQQRRNACRQAGRQEAGRPARRPAGRPASQPSWPDHAVTQVLPPSALPRGRLILTRCDVQFPDGSKTSPIRPRGWIKHRSDMQVIYF